MLLPSEPIFLNLLVVMKKMNKIRIYTDKSSYHRIILSNIILFKIYLRRKNKILAIEKYAVIPRTNFY